MGSAYNEITNKYKIELSIFLSGCLISILWILLNQEPVQSNDTNFYIHHARNIAKDGISYLFANELPPYYWLFSAILTPIQLWCPEQLPIIVVGAQALMWGGLCVLVYMICHLYCSNLSSLICSAIFGISFEILQWTNYVLSDILYVTLFTSYIYCILLLKKGFRNSIFLIICGIGLTLIFARPIGFIASCIGSLSVLITCINNHKWKSLFCYFSFYSIVGIFLVIILFSKTDKIIKNDTERVSPQGYMTLFTERFADGTIIDERPAHNLSPNQNEANWIFYMRVFSKRCIYFWSPFISGYSFIHTVINTILLMPIIITGFIGMFLSLKKLNIVEFSTLILPVVVFTGFHSLTLIDYDHRYRIPVLWIMIVFSAFVIEKIIKVSNTIYQR